MGRWGFWISPATPPSSITYPKKPRKAEMHSSKNESLSFPSFRVILEAARPKTLTAALVPILVGTSLAYGAGFALRPGLALFALLSALFIQIGTNFINDAIDFRKG